jgi:hypothetical protein
LRSVTTRSGSSGLALRVSSTANTASSSTPVIRSPSVAWLPEPVFCAYDERPLAPEQVRDPPAQEQQTAERQCIRGHDPLPVGVRAMQRTLRRGQRDIHNRDVQDDHQLRDRENRQDRPTPRVMRIIGNHCFLSVDQDGCDASAQCRLERQDDVRRCDTSGQSASRGPVGQRDRSRGECATRGRGRPRNCLLPRSHAYDHLDRSARDDRNRLPQNPAAVVSFVLPRPPKQPPAS